MHDVWWKALQQTISELQRQWSSNYKRMFSAQIERQFCTREKIQESSKMRQILVSFVWHKPSRWNSEGSVQNQPWKPIFTNQRLIIDAGSQHKYTTFCERWNLSAFFSLDQVGNSWRPVLQCISQGWHWQMATKINYLHFLPTRLF